MRMYPVFLIAAVLVTVASAASAGSLTFANGQSQWQSTRCTEPAMPTSLLAVDSETHAGDMNVLMESYNAYAGQMQSYMDCVSHEAQGDSDAASQAIVQSAQATIGNAQRKVAGLHNALQAQQR